MQSIARDSEDSTDDEFFDAHGKMGRSRVPRSSPAAAGDTFEGSPAEDFSDSEEIFVKDITKWSSNDLMDKIETSEVEEAQGRKPEREDAQRNKAAFVAAATVDEGVSSLLAFAQKPCTRRRAGTTLP